MKRIYITLTALIITTASFAGDNSADKNNGDTLVSDAIEWFYVNRQSEDIQLTWAAGEQLQSSHFEIQRSADRQSWKTIALVLASSNPNLVNKYSYIDTEAGEVEYYRIRQIDMNGQVHYSTIRAVHNPKDLYRITMVRIKEGKQHIIIG